ncbi:MAG: hypothetical protein KGR98_15150 [Verrucomicrobia bacterium]|nr:hypothetical protein [Verrucomicrobiota bacterium]MDE3099563.1 hypothetical protein [Verrucomicrobiota bacterium]
MSQINTVISSFVGSSLITTALVFLFRSWISERIKNAIKHEYDQKLETHKAQLQIAASERSIRLTRVFERQAEVIAATYAKLWAFHEAVEDDTKRGDHSDFAQSQELQKNCQSKHADVLKYFLPHKIYFPKDTAERMVYFLNTGQAAIGAFEVTLTSKGNPDTHEKNYQRFEDYSKEFAEVLALLEKDFQRILGMEEPKAGGANLPNSKSNNQAPAFSSRRMVI